MEANAADWRELLKRALHDAGSGGKATIARRLEVSRSYVSRVMNPQGKSGLPVPPAEFIHRVITRLNEIKCPITEQLIDKGVCLKALEPAPTHNPIAVQRWRTCQHCVNKPKVNS